MCLRQCFSKVASSKSYRDRVHLRPFADKIHSDASEKIWVWKTEESELWFDIGTVVNVRVEAEKWQDQAPKPPSKTASAEAAPERAVPYAIEVFQAILFPPLTNVYLILDRHQWPKLGSEA